MSSRFELTGALVGLARDGRARLIPWESGPPPRIDGYVVGLAAMDRPPPHGGEMHPDADEVLFLLSGTVDVVIEDDGGEQLHELRARQGIVIPRGKWHRVIPREPSELLSVTPGPGGEWRPPRRGETSPGRPE
jgi:mannose-6-phosphate isomerase-like protein (cupin superfamily)